MSQPQRSATPSPPKPDRDRDLKEMVNSMPVLPVPTFNPYLTIPDRATPKTLHQRTLFPVVNSTNNPVVVPPSASKKRERTSTKSKRGRKKKSLEPLRSLQQNTPSLGQTYLPTQASQNLLSDTILSSNSLPPPRSVEKAKPKLPLSKKSPKIRDIVKASVFSQSDDQDNVSLSTQELVELEKSAKTNIEQRSTIFEVEEEPNKSNQSHTEETKGNTEDTTTTKASDLYVRTPNIENPPPRWGHTLTLIKNDRLVCYGGQSLAAGTLCDLHVYNLKSRSWSKPINCSGLPRCWHTSTYIPSRQLLISFGGESINPKTGRAVTTDQIMVLDTDIMLWYPPVCSGVKPTARSGHSACLLSSSNTLVIFGGVRKGKWLNTILSLDTNLWKWSSPKIAGNAPRPRSYHSSTAITGNRIVIFGGNDGAACFQNVYVLDASSNEWKWIYPQITGDGPCPRTGHGATLLDDGKSILIHGGWDPNDEEEDDLIFDDSFILDTSDWTWRNGPVGNYGGGGPAKASKRVGYSAALVQSPRGGKEILAFGGRTMDAEFGNDFQVFQVEKKEVGLHNGD